MKDRESKNKSKLSIGLVEPVIYLRDVDFSGRRRRHNDSPPSSMVRGILTLHLSEPTKICSIGIELTAQSSTNWPEASCGLFEERQLYSSSTVYFRQDPQSRRSISHGPTSSIMGIMEDGASPDREDNQSSHARRGGSLDLHNFHRDVVSHHAASYTPSSEHVPSPENDPDESPAYSEANSSTTQPIPIPPSDRVSRLGPSLYVQSNSSPIQRDHLITIPGASSVSASPPESQRRASQALEDFRRALSSDLNVPSIRLAPPQVDTNPSALSSSNGSLSRSPPSRAPTESKDDTHHTRRGRKRFSLSTISDTLLESVRSHSPSTSEGRAEGTSVGFDPHDGEKEDETLRGRSRRKEKTSSRHLSQALTKVYKVFGIEPEEGKDLRQGWKEFQTGTYKYPISFAIPADSPPSFECAFGSVVWTLKAIVHRPGKLTSRMETAHTINVVATPSQDSDENNEGYTFRKVLEDLMVFHLSVSGQTFPIGSKIPILLRIQPLTNIRIHKVSIEIEEYIRYCPIRPEVQKAAEHLTSHVLYCLKNKHKKFTPILPPTGQDLRCGPLHALVPEDLPYTGQDGTEPACELIYDDSRPWPLRLNVKIPHIYGRLRPTNMNRKGDILVSHALLIKIQAEKMNETDGEGQGSIRLHRIVNRHPIHLLSYLSDQAYTSLPQYSPTWHSVPVLSGQPSSSRAGPSGIDLEVSAEELSNQFERLVTGQEAETGEPPPSYKATTGSVDGHHLHV